MMMMMMMMIRVLVFFQTRKLSAKRLIGWSPEVSEYMDLPDQKFARNTVKAIQGQRNGLHDDDGDWK